MVMQHLQFNDHILLYDHIYQDGYTALMKAVTKDSLDICSLLLDRGASIDLSDEVSYTIKEKHTIQ